MIQYLLRGDAPAQPTDDFTLAKVISKFTARNKKTLPEAQSIPAEDFVMRSANTAEMIRKPISITEETTNLLHK